MVIAIRAHNPERQNGIVNQKNRDGTSKMPAETINLIVTEELAEQSQKAGEWLTLRGVCEELAL